MKILCKLFGHSYDHVEMAMFRIEIASENITHGCIQCKRCKEKLCFDILK